MGRYVILLVLLPSLLSGCGKKPVADKVIHFQEDDPKMNAAIDKARATVNTFITALNTHKLGQSGLAIKMMFKDGTNIEHMWVGHVSYDGSKFHGTVSNDPENVKTVKMGQKASVAPSEISDWMYIDNKKLVGGYTLRAMRDAMEPAERAELDKSMPFVVD